MPACNFSIPFSGEPDIILAKAKAAIEGQDGSFVGNTAGGSFDVTVFGSTINGNYTVEGQNLNIIILNKPFLIPCSTIEGLLKSRPDNLDLQLSPEKKQAINQLITENLKKK